MKITTVGLYILAALGAYGCSNNANNNSSTNDSTAETPSVDKSEQALAYCQKLLNEYSDTLAVTDVGALYDHISAVKQNNPKFVQTGDSSFKPKKDIEFSSSVESGLFDCAKKLDNRLQGLMGAV